MVGLGELFAGAGVVKVQKPSAEEVERLPEGSILIAFLQPLTDPDGIERLARRGVTGFALESIPRITRAQPMDALSSQATVSGYKAVLLAADRLPRFLPDADDRGRDGSAREGARARGGRRRPPGDRDGAAARSGRVRIRRAPGRTRAGREPRRSASISASSARRPPAGTRVS